MFDLLRNREMRFFATVNFIRGIGFLVFPILFLYYLSKGMGGFEIGVLSALWGASNLIFEVPTGVVADMYGRKTSSIIGLLMISIFSALFPLANDFISLALLTLAFGLGSSFITGADAAWFVDNIKHERLGKRLGEAIALNRAFVNAGATIGAVLSSLIVFMYGMDLVWWVGAVLSVVSSMIFIFWGKEDYFKPQKYTLRQGYKKSISVFKEALSYLKNHEQLKNFVIAVAVLTPLVPLFLTTIHLKNLGFADEHFGILYAVWMGSGVFASLMAPRIVKKLKKEKWGLIALEIVYAACLLVFALTLELWVAVAAMVAGFLTTEASITLRESFFQKRVPSPVRATMGSIYAVLIPLSLMIKNVFLGAIADIDVQIAMFISMFFLLPGLWFYLKIKE